jgi:hypothetical protein
LWKYKGLNPLPGGTQNYLNFIVKFLNKIQSEALGRSELSEWIRKEFSVTGRKSPKSYIHVLIALGLVVDGQKGLSPSESGKILLETRKADVVLNALIENYAGIDEIVAFLKRKQNASSEQIREMLRETCHLDWSTPTQIGRRLSWLQALGYVVKIDGKYALSSART